MPIGPKQPISQSLRQSSESSWTRDAAGGIIPEILVELAFNIALIVKRQRYTVTWKAWLYSTG